MLGRTWDVPYSAASVPVAEADCAPLPGAQAHPAQGTHRDSAIPRAWARGSSRFGAIENSAAMSVLTCVFSWVHARVPVVSVPRRGVVRPCTGRLFIPGRRTLVVRSGRQ